MAVTMKRPDVYVNESLRSTHAITAPGTSTAMFIGPHYRGPSVAKKITSWTEFQRYFGGFPGGSIDPGYFPFAVFEYFANSGRACYCARLLGAGAMTASVQLMDRAAPAVATLAVSAIDAGAWGNDLHVGIVDRGADRFDLIVRLGGAADVNRVERWDDLSMDPVSDRYVESVVNSTLPGVGSTYITVNDLNSATASPNDRPAVIADVAMAGGANGAAPTVAQRTAAIPTILDVVDEIVNVNMPAESDSGVLNTLTAYAEARGDIFVVIDPPVGDVPAQVIAFAETLDPATSYGALYYPWVLASDPVSASRNATRLLPPGGFVLGKYAQTDSQRGVHKAPAGVAARLTNVRATERKLTKVELDDLNEAHVNAIKSLPGSGVVVFGTRTLKTTGVDRYVPVRRTLNFIKDALLDGLQWAVFEPNDEILWSGITLLVQRFLMDFWSIGGLRGANQNEAFYVKCDADLNTAAVIEQGQVITEVGVALQIPAEFVVVQLSNWEGGGAASEVAA